ncbi:MAG TPA: PAS domain S-box protein [Caldithrix abyssi]|uniref:histidine kinase n=1 Tax=Caldithrix abyssi TaxID=187145 RepID=A0A7V1LKY2_CALAY|nr:PAS domain S-box protein [Caldithrix abyssi]
MKQVTDRCYLFVNAFKHSTDAVLITDLEGKIIEVNQAFCDLFGWEHDEVIGKTPGILRAPQTSDSFYERMWQAIETKGEWKGEIVNKRKDGSLITVLLSITPIIEDGQKVGYMSIDIDLTEQIRLKQRAEHAERLAVIGKMAAKIAHEIRNPLASISLNAEILDDELKAEEMDRQEGHTLLKAIISEVDRLTHLTHDYLQFSKMSVLNPAPIEINTFLKELVHFTSGEAQQKKTALRFTPQKPLMVSVDENQLRVVLLNLLRNSMEAMEDGGEIEISLETREETFLIHVKDNGPGIPAEISNKIFEPFFSSKDLGTGLGLAISKQIVNAHNGSIFLEPSTDTGAHFIISLPLR